MTTRQASIAALLILTAIASTASGAEPATSQTTTQATSQATTQPATPTGQICLTLASDGSAIYPTTSLPVGITELNAVINMKKGSVKQMNCLWIGVNLGGNAPPNLKIAKSDVSVETEERLSLRYTHPRGLPLGKYRLEVIADGKPLAPLEFTVRPKLAVPEITDPTTLLPLRVGQSWTYDFTQEVANDANFALGDLWPGLDGLIHATVTQSVIGIDEIGTHIELRRNSALVAEEWVTLDKAGLSSRQRKGAGGDPMKLDPPQVLWAWPLRTPRWKYEPADKSYEQLYRMWGPVPIDTPKGPQPGYVVLIELTSNGARTSAESQWVPGIGMTHQSTITSLDGKRVSRQDANLKSTDFVEPPQPSK